MEDREVRVGPLLEETFYILSKKSTVYRVKLTDKGLSLQKESNGSTKTEVIRINDILGCRCMRSKRRSGASCVCNSSTNRKTNLRPVEENSGEQDEKDISAYLYIYAYVLKKFRVKSGRKRDRMTITLRFRSFDKYEDNMREAQKWRIAVKCLIRNSPIPRCILTADDTNISLQDEAIAGDEKKFLVLLNPKSGPGRAREMFQQRVVPVLAEAEMSFDLYVTKHANYARDFVRLKDIYQWRGIIVVGGDGIVFEVLNGMLEREDWKQALLEIPIGVIPGGSGNGLAKSISYANDEPYDQNPVLISSLNIVKGKPRPMDLVRVETKTQIMFSFLSVGWGFISDIDIESERLRAIGGQRFTVWSVARLIGLRTYRGKLYFLPLDGYRLQDFTVGVKASGNLKRSTSQMVDSGSKTKQIFPESPFTPVHNSISFHDNINCHPQGKDECEVQATDSLTLETSSQFADDVDLESDEHPRQRLDSYYSANSRHSAYYSLAGSTYRSLVDSVSPSSLGGDCIQPRRPNCSVQMHGPPSRLPSLMQPLPDHWVSIAGEFVMVHASYQSHLSNDCMFAPSSRLADGIIWLLIIRAGITRGQMLQFLLGLSSGSHLQCDHVEMIPVTAFRLEPEEGGGAGHITVDGELVDYGPMQVELMPSLASVLAR
ncbi:sphingosine kinase 1-like [Bacillus rossius redtenbacheri]|uniref:sphingosine kinase 1-like n=1 Tax=Bacillus rossius redtenbacheri TaxID=93214 RepID=UPI002FDCB685